LCAQKGDGYLGRPAESLPAYAKMRRHVLERAAAQGRSAGDIDFRGYLLCLFDGSRREALNRAKREPFVIYMISVLSDISLKRAGFDPQLRTQIAAAWRAEDYHRAGELIPDELLDAFILCGTVDEVAARATACSRRRAGWGPRFPAAFAAPGRWCDPSASPPPCSRSRWAAPSRWGRAGCTGRCFLPRCWAPMVCTSAPT